MPATLAASGLGKPVPVRGGWHVRRYGVTAGQTFKVGDIVLLDSNGTLVIGAAAGSVIDASTDKVVGFAQANAADCLAQTGEYALCPVLCPNGQGSHFLAVLYHATAASAVIAETDIDAPTVLPIKNVSGQWVLDLATDGTDDIALVVERHPAYAFSDQYAWYWCQFQQQALLFGSAYAQT